MNRNRLLGSILIFIGIVGSVFVYDMVQDRSPVLGLDLRGGLSVIYAAKEEASQDDLTLVRDQMRDQLETFGIAEPDVRLDGDNIVADLPGVSDQAAAQEALNVSGVVTLRPVIGCQPTISETVILDGNEDNQDTGDDNQDGDDDNGDDVEGESAGIGNARFKRTIVESPTSEPEDGEDGEDGGDGEDAPAVTLPPGAIVTGNVSQPDPAEGAFGEGQEMLQNPGGNEECLVGPSGGSGEVFEKQGASAQVGQYGGWVVDADLKRDGEAQWNALARECYSTTEGCPSGRLAIVLDSEIQSAPNVNEPEFTGTVQISGSFDQEEAEALAAVINRGAYPVEVVVERTETVSPTAGQDSLDAAILAGLIGIALMLAIMIVYYRKLSVVMVIGLMVWGVTVYVLATYVSQATNYALTLAGATGIIIAVGVTVDTYVVFFERIRDERRSGRTFANAAPRSYRVTGRTVVSADVVSLIASLILFSLSVGSVKGFALYLGLTTVCDLLVFYFFTRPAVILLSQTRWGRNAGLSKAVSGATA